MLKLKNAWQPFQNVSTTLNKGCNVTRSLEYQGSRKLSKFSSFLTYLSLEACPLQSTVPYNILAMHLPPTSPLPNDHLQTHYPLPYESTIRKTYIASSMIFLCHVMLLHILDIDNHHLILI